MPRPSGLCTSLQGIRIKTGLSLLFFLPFGFRSPLLSAERSDGVSVLSSPPVQIFGEYVYTKPGWLTFIKQAPGDIKDYSKMTFQKEKVVGIALVAMGTGLLIIYDQWILDRAQELGDLLHISHSHGQKTFATVKIPLTELKLQGPHDSGSALYFIGDGWVDLWTAAGFLTYGSLKTDYRALQTSSQIVESVLTSGAVVQLLKHITGRESPVVATRAGGRWQFFPDQFEYHRHVPHYDAFPAGHIAASIATLTVIAANYPEYKFIRPLGYTLIGLLGFQMLNNGVHWASDYPLAIALGYGFGHLAVSKGRTRRSESGLKSLRFSPIVRGNTLGIAGHIKFR